MHYGSVVEYDDAYVEYNTCYIYNCVMVLINMGVAVLAIPHRINLGHNPI